MTGETMQNPQSAFILAAGLGLRMRPLTETKPKPLVNVSGKPLIDYSLELVQSAGINNVIINASYLADKLTAYLAERAPAVRISHEDTPLETGGGIREALHLLGDKPFLTINSDVICVPGSEHPVSRLSEAWNDEEMDALLLLQPTDHTVGFNGKGDFFLEKSGSVKRRGDVDAAPYVYTGIQLVHPRLFNDCPKEGGFSLNVLYDRGRLEDGTLPRIKGLVHDGSWLHVGDLDGLESAEKFFSAKAKAYA